MRGQKAAWGGSPAPTAVPAALRARPQWLLWRLEDRGGKQTKVPYRAEDPARQASTTDSSTWATFEGALGARQCADGVGFVFTAGDPFVGIDLDDCIDEHGEIEPWAAEIVEELDSYAELTPSGRGIHVIVRGALRGERRRTGHFEVYSEGRYFTMTGERIGDRQEVEERQAPLDRLLARVLPPREPAPPVFGGGLPTDDDDEVLERAFATRKGAKVQALYRGQLNGYVSQSEADLALLSYLAFWTGRDPARLDRLFRSSGLMRDKWDSPRGESTYGEQTIEKALRRSDFYEHRSQTPREAAERSPEGAGDGEVKAELAELLDLPSVGLTISGARIVGRGSRASADLFLSDGSEISFESLRDFANPTRLAVEVAACCGATPALKTPMALKAMALLRNISERRETFTQDQEAFEWGASFLQAASVITVDIDNGEDRWRAFCELQRIDPRSVAREQGLSLAAASSVLLHTDGTRLVRTGWFHDYARSQDVSAGGNADIAARMERVGWRRRGSIGRIKATRPDFPGKLAWSFFEVSKGWEDAE